MNAEMEPILATDPALAGVLDELVTREPIFHRPELGMTRAHFENMMMPDFWEIGASGRRYSRDFVLAELEKRHRVQTVDVWENYRLPLSKVGAGSLPVDLHAAPTR
jgi:hypothetical protein